MAYISDNVADALRFFKSKTPPGPTSKEELAAAYEGDFEALWNELDSKFFIFNPHGDGYWTTPIGDDALKTYQEETDV